MLIIKEMTQDTSKKTILLVWGYERRTWIHPFEVLKDHFHFVYLRYIHASEEEVCFTQEEKIYWSQFKNAKEIIEKIRPEKVVFMSIYNGLDIALNSVCKKYKIPTYILQHGLFTTYEDYRAREIYYKKAGVKIPENHALTASKEQFSSLAFIKNSLSIKDMFSIWKLPLYYYLQKKESSLYASRNARFSQRTPDYYICYSKRNARIHIQLDNAGDEKFKYIGNPEFDDYFKSTYQATSISNYYLHIDQAFAGNRFGENIVSKEQMIDFLEKLNRFCVSKTAKLVVKLHPENYKSEWLPQHENIVYIKETNEMIALIKNASGCFGFFSTLLLPAVYFNTLILFKMSESDFQKDIQERGLALLLNFHDFDEKAIDFNQVIKNREALNKFEEEYFYKTDGDSLGRLRVILNSN